MVGAYLVLLAVGVVHLVVLDDPLRTLRGTAPFALALTGYLVVRRRDPWRVLRILGGAQAALAVATLAAFARAWPVGADDPSGFYRVKVLVTTAAGDHNTVGGLLLVGVVVCAVLAVAGGRDGGPDRRWWAGVVLTTAGVVATLSRGAALVLLVAGLAALVVRVDRRVALTTLGAGAAATGAVTGLAAWLGAAPPASTGPSAGLLGASVTGRFDLIGRGFVATLDAPGWGVGYGRFVEVAGDLPFPNLHAHNAVAHLGAEAGVLGAAVAIVLAVALAERTLLARPSPLRDATLVGGAALLGHAQLDVLAGLWAYELLLAVLLGVAVRVRADVDAGGQVTAGR